MLKTGKELFRFKTPSGIIGNVSTWKYNNKQYVGIYSGIGGWAGLAIADANIDKDCDNCALGAAGAYRSLSSYTKLGGVFSVFALPD